MPRKAKGPRLYLDRERKQWAIRDGSSYVRTGCAESDSEGAEKKLAEYIARKYRPAPSPSPLIADVLLLYAKDHLPTTRAADRGLSNISNLTPFWGMKKAEEVTKENCTAYADGRPQAAGRRDLETLRAALFYWHENHQALARVPMVHLPDKTVARERWLTREEAKRLRRSAMKFPHLYRFIILGLATGTRSGILLGLRWDQINLASGVLTRRRPGETDAANKSNPPVRLKRSVTRLLARWKAKDGKIPWVIHYDGERIYSVKNSWKATCKDAKITGASPHTMRHTRATWLMQGGVDLWEAAGHLGMSVRVLETVYGKHHPDFQSGAAEV
jgi:integrase